MGIKAIIDRCERLYRDVDLGCVQEWKARTGGKAVGYMPVYVPRELIHAAGLLPVGVMGGGDDVEIIRGDAYFQSYICHIPRSTVELGLAGKLQREGEVMHVIAHRLVDLSRWLGRLRSASRDFH